MYKEYIGDTLEEQQYIDDCISREIYYGDDISVIGGIDLPEKYLRKDVVEFNNYPKDDKSWHLLQLISLHLWKISDENKDKIIDFVFRVVTDDKNCKERE